MGLDGYETGVWIVKVDRWWKGDLAPEVELISMAVKYPNGMGGNASEAYSFAVGKSYFITAYQTPYGLTANRCNGLTQPAEFLDRIIVYIGDGMRPIKYPPPAIIKY